MGTFYKDMIPETTEDAITFSSLIQIGTKRYFGISIPLYNINKTQIKGRCGAVSYTHLTLPTTSRV